MEKIVAIVLSAGTGSRMNSDKPKQYMDLNGKPVIYYSLKAFEESNSVSSIILVAGEQDIDYCQNEIVNRYQFKKVAAIVPGGKERFESVFQGLKAIPDTDTDFVLVHDGARPMVTPSIIERAIKQVHEDKACVVAVPVKDTIKMVDEYGYTISTPDRKSLWQMQTPQCFAYTLLRGAYTMLNVDLAAGRSVPSITDDAMVVEYAMGQKAKMVEGSYENIKITTPEDLKVAEMFLQKRN